MRFARNWAEGEQWSAWQTLTPQEHNKSPLPSLRLADGRAVYLDVSQAEDIQQLIDETVSEHGRLDYMFNNAGIAIAGEVRDLDLEHWQRMLDVNLWGIIHGTTAAYQVMSE